MTTSRSWCLGVVLALSAAPWTAALLFLLASSADGQEIVILSNNITVQSGEGALLLCVGFSSTSAEITISWMRRGQTVDNSSSSLILEEDLVLGGRMFKQSYLQLCSLQYDDTDEYTCSVSNGTHSSQDFLQLDVKGFAELVVLSNGTLAQTGGSAMLVCTGFSQPHNSSSIAWTKDGRELSNSSTVTTTEEDSTQGGRQFRTSYLVLCELQHSDSGNYTCIVSNGEQSDNATTSLYVPDDAFEIVVVSNQTTGTLGGSAMLVCVAFGRPEAALSISWFKRDRVVVNSTDISIIVEDTTQQNRDFKQSYLKFCSLKYADTANYTCTVGNGVTVVNSTSELFISSTLNPGSNSIRQTCSSGQAAREAIYLDTLQLISREKGVNLLGVTRDYAAPSCSYIASVAPNKRTGDYWISDGNGAIAQQTCTF